MILSGSGLFVLIFGRFHFLKNGNLLIPNAHAARKQKFLKINPIPSKPWGHTIIISGRVVDSKGEGISGEVVRHSRSTGPYPPNPTKSEDEGKYSFTIYSNSVNLKKVGLEEEPRGPHWHIGLISPETDDYELALGDREPWYALAHNTVLMWISGPDYVNPGQPAVFSCRLIDRDWWSGPIPMTGRRVELSGTPIVDEEGKKIKKFSKTDSSGTASFRILAPKIARSKWDIQARYDSEDDDSDANRHMHLITNDGDKWEQDRMSGWQGVGYKDDVPDSPYYISSVSPVKSFSTSGTGSQTGQITIKSIRFLSPDLKRTLDWNKDIIGFEGLQYAHIMVLAVPPTTVRAKPPPQEIKIQVTRRPPKLVGISDVLDKTNLMTAVFPLHYIKKSSDQKNYVYTNDDGHAISVMYPSSPVPNNYSVASVVRKFDNLGSAESDKYFREGHNFVNRGSAVETGPDKVNERPDPRKLFLAGGVEVIEIKILPQRDIQLSKDPTSYTEKIPLKSPADIFYYSGHGNSNLKDPTGVVTSVSPPMTPEELLTHWNKNKIEKQHSSVKALVIAGCSVASIHKILGKSGVTPTFIFNRVTGTRKGTGMRWSRLLNSQGGPVEYICGYWGGAPSDKNGGNTIAKGLGVIIREDSKVKNNNLALSWVQLHKDLYGNTKPTVAGLTNNDFIYIDKSITGGESKVTSERINAV